MAEPAWADTVGGETGLPTVAYFSPEFGLAASVPQYSGGLGVLAGDHLKAAADLHVPIIGVGLFYRSGYFRQMIDREGQQHERFPWQHPTELALTKVDDLQVSLRIGTDDVVAAIWKARVGPNELYLLDTHVPERPAPISSSTTGCTAVVPRNASVRSFCLGSAATERCGRSGSRPTSST